MKTAKIETTAYLGQSGQDAYAMTIFLGKRALRKYKNGKSIIDCVPSEETMEWIKLDVEKKWIHVTLK